VKSEIAERQRSPELNTKVLLTASASFMAVCGLAATFLPQEILARVGEGSGPVLTLIVQAAGALYFAFAILNWMAKDSLIGGIYARPISLGNLVHFFIGAITLLKAIFAGHRGPMMATAGVAYSLFAAGFIWIVFFWSPVKPGALPD
jgi:hypothetical protein